MNGFWTFSPEKDVWEQPIVFETKDEAIMFGRKQLACDFYIGQLSEYEEDKFEVVSVENIH